MTSRIVLVVGDSRREREQTCAAVQELGYEPVAVDGCEQCLDSLDQLQPVAVVVDLEMSPIRGDACCRRIKESYGAGAVPVLITTRSELPHELMQIWRADADDFLIHPVDPACLRTKLEALSREVPGHSQDAGKQDPLVLFAEPSRFFRRLFGENLQHSGVRVLHALDGDEALELATEHAQELDACLVDLAIPGTSGLEVVETLAGLAALQGKPLVVFTGVPARKDVVERVKALTGAEPVLKRELHFENILARVRGAPRSRGINLRAAERRPFFSMIEFSTDQQTWSTGFSYDVSAGGLFVRTLTPAPAGAPIRIRTRFAGAREPSVSDGVVAWSNPYQARRTFSSSLGMGIHLTEVAPQLWNQISRLVRGDRKPTPSVFAEVSKQP